MTFRTRLARLEVALGARNAPAAGLTAFRSVCRLFELFACAAERGGQDTVWMRSKTAELAAVPDVEERERTAGAILVQMRSIWLRWSRPNKRLSRPLSLDCGSPSTELSW